MEAGEIQVNEKGASQESVISPLLANIYLNALDSWWERNGAGVGRLVRYADDMVIICITKQDAVRAMELLRYVMWKLDLTLHPTKSRLAELWKRNEGFDFLGMHHTGHSESGRGKKYYRTVQYHCKKAMKKTRETVESTLRRRERISWRMEDLIRALNPKIIGWRNYCGVKTVKRWLNCIDWYIIETFTRWDSRKRQKKSHISSLVNIRKAIYQKGLQRLAA